MQIRLQKNLAVSASPSFIRSFAKEEKFLIHFVRIRLSILWQKNENIQQFDLTHNREKSNKIKIINLN